MKNWVSLHLKISFIQFRELYTRVELFAYLDPTAQPKMSQQEPPQPTESKDQSQDAQQKPKITISSKDIQTPLGTREDVNRQMMDLLNELKKSQADVDVKIGAKLRRENTQRRKALEGRLEHEQNDDLPVDGDYVSGSRIFMVNCAGCHTLESSNQGARSVTGPPLGLIYGKKAGSDVHFKYTEGMVQSETIWSERNLHNYLKNPKRMFPDARCDIKYGGLSREEDRADIIQFFKLFTKNLKVNLRLKANKMFGKDYVATQEHTHEKINAKNYEDFRDSNGGDFRR